jgi:transcription elongation factor Elf1
MEYFFTCPYCWQQISVVIDVSAGSQSYIEDCEICCNPISLKYECENSEIMYFEAEKIQ